MKVGSVMLLMVAPAIFCGLLQTADGANILAIFTLPGKSHWIVFRDLLLELAKKGHHLTVMSYFQEDAPNWEKLQIEPHWDAMPINDLFKYGEEGPVKQFMDLFSYGEASCTAILKEEGVQNLIKSKNRNFDLLFMEVFFNDCFLAFAHRFKVPVVAGVAFGGGSSWMNDMVGNPYPYAYLPEAIVTYSSSMSFLQRMHNSMLGTYLRIYRQLFYLSKLDSVISKYFNDPSMPALSSLERNVSLLLLNTHVSFFYPRPLVPNAIEVGGMHIRQSKKLPQDLHAFLDEAADGVIYFSMGSNVKSSDISEQKRKALLRVFSKLKQKILWKFEVDSLPDKPDNVIISNWLPQNDILAHKNLKLFITHGGLMSIEEALYSGVPMLGIPIFGDQAANLNRAQESGYAIKLSFNNLTEESFEWAISELLTNPRFREAARKYSHIFHDRPMKPQDTAIYWIEYVLRHNGAYHMRNAALDLTWYQYLLLDVVFTVITALLAFLIVIGLAIRTVFRIVCRQQITLRRNELQGRTKKE